MVGSIAQRPTGKFTGRRGFVPDDDVLSRNIWTRRVEIDS
jgi:hypothetical protein